MHVREISLSSCTVRVRLLTPSTHARSLSDAESGREREPARHTRTIPQLVSNPNPMVPVRVEHHHVSMTASSLDKRLARACCFDLIRFQRGAHGGWNEGDSGQGRSEGRGVELCVCVCVRE